MVGAGVAEGAAVQVPPVAVLLAPVVIPGVARPIAGPDLAEDRIRADRLLTVKTIRLAIEVKTIRQRPAAASILGLLVRQPLRPTPRADSNTILEISTIQIIPLIQIVRRVEYLAGVAQAQEESALTTLG